VLSQVGQDRLSELIDAEFAKAKPQHPGSSVEDLILWRRNSDCWHRKEQPLVESLAKRLSCPLQAINQKKFWSKSRVRAGRRCTVTTIEGAWKSRNPIGQYAVVTKQLHSAIVKFVRGVPLACLNDSSREHLDIGSQSLKGRFAEMTRDWREHLHVDLTVDARGWADNWQCFKRAGVFKAGEKGSKASEHAPMLQHDQLESETAETDILGCAGCSAKGGCASGRCPCLKSHQPCSPTTCGCSLFCRNPINKFIREKDRHLTRRPGWNPILNVSKLGDDQSHHCEFMECIQLMTGNIFCPVELGSRRPAATQNSN
jgi:hypothetical protein